MSIRLNYTLLLAIETSCDETAISVLRISKNKLEILSNEISSQVKLHAKWGGVVPNLAAREHVKNITSILELSLKNARVKIKDIDVIAVTEGPGLIPALMVGVNFAKTLSYIHNKPLIGIHHIEGHVYANFLGKIGAITKSQEPKTKQIPNSKITNKNEASEIKNSKFDIQNSPNIKFPILCLVVSGGHTQLVYMQDHLKYEVVGQTLDDAVGEAFDKVARILNIGYPGGPAVAQRATEFPMTNFQFPNKPQEPKTKNQNKSSTKYKIQDICSKLILGTRYDIHFPRPMINKPEFNFSFSGLKTAVLYETKKNPDLLRDKKYIAEICHEFQQAAIDVLISKTLKAAEKHQPKTIMLAGGVSANTELRQQLGEAIVKNLSDTSYCVPDLNLTGDNAAMIAAAASFRFSKMNEKQKQKALGGWKNLQPNANLKMK